LPRIKFFQSGALPYPIAAALCWWRKAATSAKQQGEVNG